MHRVKISCPSDKDYMPTYVSIDGKSISCQGIKYEQYVGEVPTCVIETKCKPDIDALADIQFSFTPETVADAVDVIENCYANDSRYKKEIQTCIAEKLKEIPAGTGVYDIAERLADKIFGEVEK